MSLTVSEYHILKGKTTGCHACVLFILLGYSEVVNLQQKAYCTSWQSNNFYMILLLYFFLTWKPLELHQIHCWCCLIVITKIMMTIHHAGVKRTTLIYFYHGFLDVDSLIGILFLVQNNCLARVTTLDMLNLQVQNFPFQCKIRFLHYHL